jgi:hypothetical protein
MSKKVGFPVMSASITGYLYILALVLGSLTLLISGLGLDLSTTYLVNGLLYFIGAFFAGWAMLSFALHPALDSNQRLIATIFTAILLLVYFNAGVHFSLTF